MPAPLFDVGSLVELNTGPGTSFTTAGMTTAHVNEVIVVVVLNTGDSTSPTPNYAVVSSVTATGLTFVKRVSQSIAGLNYDKGTGPHTGGISLEVWWAHAATTLSSIAITVNFATAAEFVGIAGFGVSGCGNPAVPWDNNVGLPVVASAVSGGTTALISTSESPDLLFNFGAFAVDAATNPPGVPMEADTPATWTQIATVSAIGSPGAPSFQMSVVTKSEATTVSGLNASYIIIQPAPINAIIYLADALTAEVPPPSGKASLADLWFGATPGFFDLTQVANRRLFISAIGGAQSLGVNGQTPLGGSPAVFLSEVSVPPDFANNLGIGGSFPITSGALTAAVSSPPGSSNTVTTITAPSLGVGVLGDYRNGNLYAMNMDTLTDNGTPRKWLRTWRGLPERKSMTTTYHSLLISMETGSIQVPEGTDPQVMLRWSSDGGHTWDNERFQPVGETGQTGNPVKFNRLGSTRRFSPSGRVFELSSTDEFKVAILDAEVDVS